MTLVPPPPPAPTPSQNPPPLDKTDAWLDHYYFELGLNPIPVVSRFKTGKKGYDWKEWQTKSIPEELFQQWKNDNAYADGIGLPAGVSWRGKYAGKYFTFIDLDNQIAIDEFCTRDGVKATLEQISEKFIVEQHLDNRSKCHIFFFSEVIFPKKSSDKNNQNFDEEHQPAIEVKGRGSHGISFNTPSFNKSGHRYEIIGTLEPAVLNPSEANGMMDHLDDICRKYGLKYRENLSGGDNGGDGSDDNDRALIPMREMEKEDFEILEGHNRHEGLLRYMESRLVIFGDRVPEQEIKELCYIWNKQHCKPPLDDEEFERQWKDAKKFVARKDVERAEQERLEQEQRVQRLLGKGIIGTTHLPQPDIPAEWRNDYFEYLVWCAQKEVKEENALVRQIVLTILSAYGSDPSNLGIMAPTSTGKSWAVNKCIIYTPGGKEVRPVGSMTPKVLIREKGILVDRNGEPIGGEVRKLKAAIKTANAKKHYDEVNKLQDELEALTEESAYIINLSGMVLVFLEPPHPELWNLLKPILAHDAWEMEHSYVDNIGRGIEVKRVITRGWPACIFCSAKDESKWEVWPEIESRFAISSPNIIKLKFEKGNELIWQKKWLPRAVKQKIIISDKEIDQGKSCFLYLKHQVLQYKEKTDSPVWAPFGEYVGAAFPADRGQDNRAFNRFTTMLNTIALCKAHLRYKVLFGKEELIIPSLRDLQETLHVLQNMTGLPPHKLNFYKDYIYKLWKNNGSTGSLKGSEIVAFYNTNNPDKRHPMNGENLRNNYLKELVNHNYLEQEQDESTKATRYVYTPLIKVENEELKEPLKEAEEEQKESLTSLIIDRKINKLQYSKLILPKSHPGIPENWLSLQISQLRSHLSTIDQLIILSPDGKVVDIEEFVAEYEKDVKLTEYISTPEVNKAS